MSALALELLAALRSDEGRALLGELIEQHAGAALRRVLAEQREQLQPLHELLNCTPSAARMRLTRDTALRALAHRVGRRSLFRASEVRQLLAARNPEREAARELAATSTATRGGRR